MSVNLLSQTLFKTELNVFYYLKGLNNYFYVSKDLSATSVHLLS